MKNWKKITKKKLYILKLNYCTLKMFLRKHKFKNFLNNFIIWIDLYLNFKEDSTLFLFVIYISVYITFTLVF